ncbi:4Fe-4S dicluster domain-containing protein [Magnetospirillum sp. 15-1]|uniref:4Fe-4S dicluster domain-containing protein n=1 Tax=Magnetospirillum sp. 15-1 TaxID=1979370 RepID=UPI00148382A8|nr:4Fe-4S dicluster domain-containing protein [Magnetospirillum sp. 15-1]
MRLGMVIDLKRCIACYGCQLSCKAEHGTPPGVFFARVLKREEGVYPTVRQLFLPVLCNHCDDAPCVEVCPTEASHHASHGVVDIDHDKCVGCRACMMACPYNNRYFHDERQFYFPESGPTVYETARSERHPERVVMKCNFCAERRAEGKLPACVANCAAGARYFGDLHDPNSEVSRLIRDRGGFTLHPEAGTGPAVYYLAP